MAASVDPHGSVAEPSRHVSSVVLGHRVHSFALQILANSVSGARKSHKPDQENEKEDKWQGHRSPHYILNIPDAAVDADKTDDPDGERRAEGCGRESGRV